MYNKELAKEILNQIHNAAYLVIQRFENVNSVSDFTNSPAGMEKLDSICMQLIVVGEGLKNFDKITFGKELPKYPQVEWKKAKGLRDIITHHYFDVNAEAIYDICENKIEALADTINKIIEDIN
ncbi:MAG: antitoxin [Bacteroidetes bacterium 4484_249]|nr:MAG: antitoxin [Bacteroidetes bacterium 4484_249]